MEDLMQNINNEENESRDLVRQLKILVTAKRDLDQAFHLFLKCSEKKWKPSLENFILSIVNNLCLDLAKSNQIKEAIRWMNQVFLMAKNSNNEEFHESSLSILARLHLKSKQWDKAQTCLSIMRSVDSKSNEKNFLELQIALQHQISTMKDENLLPALNAVLSSVSNDMIQMKTIIKLVVDSGSKVALQMSLEIILKEIKENLTDSVELYCFTIMLSINHRLEDCTIEFFGDYVNWYRLFTESERKETLDLHLRIIDYVEHKVETILKVEANEKCLKEASQLSAALLLLHDKSAAAANSNQESLFRALNYQLRCKYLLEGLDEALKYLEKFTRRWTDKKSLFLRKLLLDLELGNRFETSTSQSWSQWLIGLNETPPEDLDRIKNYLMDIYSFVTSSTDVENHIKGTYLNLIVRLSTRSWMTCTHNEDLRQNFIEILDAASESLSQYADETSWSSQLLWNIALKMNNGCNSSRFFGRAAKLLPMDGMDRITCRIAQLGALIETYHNIPCTPEVEEAIQDLSVFLENYQDDVDNSNQLKRIISVFRLKMLVLMGASEVSYAVADAARTADLPTLEMFASLLTGDEYQSQRLTALRMAITCAVRQDDPALLRCSYVLMQELIADLDIDGILDLIPDILAFSQSQINSDEVQMLTLMITARLWNTSVRLSQADPYFEKSRQLKNVVSSLVQLIPNYEKFFHGKISSVKISQQKKLQNLCDDEQIE